VLWRNRTRLTGGALGKMPGFVRAAAVVGAVTLMGTAWAVGTAGGMARGDSGPMAGDVKAAGGPGTSVEYRVSAAGQRAAVDYWTPARMAAAQPTAIERAAGAANAKAPNGTPWASHFTGEPAVGALFSTTGGNAHFCTASVVDSPVGDIVLTAAHCIYSHAFAANVEYVPEYHNGHLPYGRWAVQQMWVARGWKASHDPNLDFAFLTVAPVNGRKIQSVTGGLRARFLLGYSEHVEVIGYNDTDSEPVRCATTSFEFRTNQMEFYCHDFWDGTSGGPWIIYYNPRAGGGTVIGVIGGYEQGGSYEWASYSSYFGVEARSLLGVAESNALGR
jgi:V8-like Glu-specific endopeptidase